jgi:hypothetical protein
VVRASAPSALDRARQAAVRDRKARFATLLHHLTIERLCDAFLSLEKKATAEADGVTWVRSRAGLERNLGDFHERLHRGTYC